MVNDIKIEQKEKQNLFLAALNPYIQSNTVSNEEKVVSGKDFVSWGENNRYPNFLWENYSNCATLGAVVNGTADYITGADAICNVADFSKTVNKRGETINDILAKVAIDYLVYGSYALQVIKNLGGDVSEIYWVDVSKLRSDKKNEVFFYSEDWGKSYGRVKYVTYPKYKYGDNNGTSIYFFKGKARNVYGTPMWSAAIKSVQIEQAINDFQLNEINNNFLSSKLISFCNGVPDDNLKNEIERNLNEKFSGASNAGRLMISFADSKDNAPVILDLSSDDFDKRYETLEKRARQQIFVAFRCTPLLMGLVSESNGFATNEYRDSYKLFYNTVILPIQRAMVDSFDKIFGIKDSITIIPFTIEFDDEKNNKIETPIA